MQMGQSVTHAAIQPTHSPSWEELLLIEVKEEESKDEGLSPEQHNGIWYYGIYLQYVLTEIGITGQLQTLYHIFRAKL